MLQVFGLYFMQTYIGIFYHALARRNFATLRQLLLQRLIISQVEDNVLFFSCPLLENKYTIASVRYDILNGKLSGVRELDGELFSLSPIQI